MYLYLIECKTEKRRYATNADNLTDAGLKFIKERGDRLSFIVSKITPEKLTKIEDNDSIIFF